MVDDEIQDRIECFSTEFSDWLTDQHKKYKDPLMMDTPKKKKDFREKTGLKTVPQIYVSSTGHHIGGYEELEEYVKL